MILKQYTQAACLNDLHKTLQKTMFRTETLKIQCKHKKTKKILNKPNKRQGKPNNNKNLKNPDLISSELLRSGVLRCLLLFTLSCLCLFVLLKLVCLVYLVFLRFLCETLFFTAFYASP